MINGKKVSVVMTTCDKADRLKTIPDVISAWLWQPIDEFIFCDCSSSLTLPLIEVGCRKLIGEDSDLLDKLIYIKFSKDRGIRVRHAMALISIGDYVINADDDVLPLSGFAQDLCDGLDKAGGGIVGIIGRQFGGKQYRSGQFYGAAKIQEPTMVDFIGVVYCSGRDMLPFDMREQESAVSDLFWAEAFVDAPKHVIPTRKYKNLKSAHHAECLFHDLVATAYRQKFYERQFDDKKYYRARH